MTGLAIPTVPRTLFTRIVAGIAALLMASPLPWTTGPGLDLGALLFVLVGMLAALAMPLGRWAVGSWTMAALTGAVLNLGWSYYLVLDRAAGPFYGLFLFAPYAAFTAAGCIGWFRERQRKFRWVGIVAPTVLYLLPMVVLGIVNSRR